MIDPIWGKIKASDIRDETMVRAINAVVGNWGVWDQAAISDIFEQLPQFPWRVVRAKLASMQRRKLIDGCIHTGRTNCRGDIEIIDGRWRMQFDLKGAL